METYKAYLRSVPFALTHAGTCNCGSPQCAARRLESKYFFVVFDIGWFRETTYWLSKN